MSATDDDDDVDFDDLFLCREEQPPLRMYLVICNIQKLANVKALMNTAFAFGCQQVWVVGQAKNTDSKTKETNWIPKKFQQALDRTQIKLLQFHKWQDCLDHLKSTNIPLVGVEIDATSQVLDSTFALGPAYRQEIAILMGNEGQGIHPKHLQSCQALLRIPQYGTGTASFNVNVACSIVLYHLNQWKHKKDNKNQQRQRQHHQSETTASTTISSDQAFG